MALRHPEHLQTIGRVIAIPFKRHEQNSVNYLNLDEIKALLRAPNRTTWLGRRDHALLLTAIQTGVRVTELVTLRICDVSLGTGAHLQILGKGRKRRTASLTRETVAVLRQWLKERQGQPEEPLFPTRQGRPLTRSGAGQLVAKHTAAATVACTSLKTKDVSPHTLRHTNAMLLRAGDVDIATIALWLGHESIKTTRIYEHADPALKEKAIARIAPFGTKPGRYRPTDTLLAFLEGL
jgi:integrase